MGTTTALTTFPICILILAVVYGFVTVTNVFILHKKCVCVRVHVTGAKWMGLRHLKLNLMTMEAEANHTHTILMMQTC